MAAELNTFTNLLTEQSAVFLSIKKLLNSLIAAAKKKDGDGVTAISAQLSEAQQKAALLDRRLVEFVAEVAPRYNVKPQDFKLSLIAPDAVPAAEIDALRLLVSETARLSAQAGGVLSANIEVIDQTIKVLESIDASGVGYSSDKGYGAPSRPSKMIDRTA